MLNQDPTMSSPYTIQIYMAEGLPDGLRLVTKPNWSGVGIVCPRDRYPVAKGRSEFSASGVYLLVGRDDDGAESLYIGVSENVRSRIDEHYKNLSFWRKVIVFGRSDPPLNKADVAYIESSLVQRAQVVGRWRCKNGNTPRSPTLSLPDKAAMDGYEAEIRSLLPALGVDAFERAETRDVREAESGVAGRVERRDMSREARGESHRTSVAGGRIYRLKKGCDARGFQIGTKFKVLEGSVARREWTDSARKHKPSYFRLREKLVREGILVLTTGGEGEGRYRFSRNYDFGSPSQAALVCAGAGIDYLGAWKCEETGISLREHNAREAR